MNAVWYAKRLASMSPREVARRVRDQAVKQRLDLWPPRLRAWSTGSMPKLGIDPIDLDESTRSRLLSGADELLEGSWETLGVRFASLGEAPDWFHDPDTGTDISPRIRSSAVDTRDPKAVGHVKAVWELSRHHHLTLLSAAYFVSGENAYAERVADHLRSWWEANPLGRGVNWTSGIEVGLRLISWTWIRRLLDGWAGAGELFEHSNAFRTQLFWHQVYLASLPSHGSSANNHRIAEAVGLFVSALAFPLFPKSAKWQSVAAQDLAEQAERQTFPMGWNREQATAYHEFALELFLLAACEGDAHGRPLDESVWETLGRMADVLAATADAEVNPPRQGDDDGGVGLLVDDQRLARSRIVLDAAATVLGPCDWWPKVPAESVLAPLLGRLASRPDRRLTTRYTSRVSHFPDAGMAILRTDGRAAEEIWVRCDAGPQGLSSLAAHGHADALSVEVRYGGVEVLADPGTYTYRPDLPHRQYFRSTIAHNTVEIGGRSQATAGGNFLWSRKADGQLISASGFEGGDVVRWMATHDGYSTPHRRQVVLDRPGRTLSITDEVDSPQPIPVRMAFHLGPAIQCELDGSQALLQWPGTSGDHTARFALPDTLAWRAWRGSHSPMLGWYSRDYGHLEPSITLVGEGSASAGKLFHTRLLFDQEVPE